MACGGSEPAGKSERCCSAVTHHGQLKKRSVNVDTQKNLRLTCLQSIDCTVKCWNQASQTYSAACPWLRRSAGTRISGTPVLTSGCATPFDPSAGGRAGGQPRSRLMRSACRRIAGKSDQLVLPAARAKAHDVALLQLPPIVRLHPGAVHVGAVRCMAPQQRVKVQQRMRIGRTRRLHIFKYSDRRCGAAGVLCRKLQHITKFRLLIRHLVGAARRRTGQCRLPAGRSSLIFQVTSP